MLDKIMKATAVVCLMFLMACGGSSDKRESYAGRFTDEFGNRFELRDDGTGTMQFVEQDIVNDIVWFDGSKSGCPYSTIEWNGNVNYYYLRDGVMYRHREDMDGGRCAISITYE